MAGASGTYNKLRGHFAFMICVRRVVIITTGFGPVVEAALDKVDLLGFFSEVRRVSFVIFQYLSSFETLIFGVILKSPKIYYILTAYSHLGPGFTI